MICVRPCPSPAALRTVLLLALQTASLALGAEPERCGTKVDGGRDLEALHRYVVAAGTGAAQHRSASPSRTVNDVAVLEDRDDFVIARNPFDLDGRGVRLVPNREGGYDPASTAALPGSSGTVLAVSEDTPRLVALPFAFPFFGHTYREVYLSADGHLTLGRPDTIPGERGLSRFLSGPPRIAPFFADLDPGRGGAISTRMEAGRAAFLWEGVPGGGQVNRNTFEASLFPDGSIEFAYARDLQTREALVGVSPGAVDRLNAADYSRAQPVGTAYALVERFSESEKLDLVSVTRRVLADYGDVFDQVVVYTARPLNPVPGTLAFEVNVSNRVQGIGLAVFDHTAEWGSAGRLESVVYMDSIDQYLEFDGFEFLAHEVGHRWGARLQVAGPGIPEGTLLGSGSVHWSFFLDTDASVLDGNDLADRGGGRFETVDIARRYSPLDQYAMGLREAADVPPFFYVAEPDDFRPNRPYKATSAPEGGVSFTGVRRDLTIAAVVAALGPRVPPRGPAVIRQAFVVVADGKAAATDARLSAASRIRTRFEEWFRQATDLRGAVDTRLR
jgi:hypothetical protein